MRKLLTFNGRDIPGSRYSTRHSEKALFRSAFFPVVFMIQLVISSCGNSISGPKAENGPPDFDHFLEIFNNPPASYAPAPLFVWNNLVTKEDLNYQLKELKDKGFGGVFVHPRPGMVNEYLSADWFDLFGYTVSRCRELGMGVWIYDENSYPSGFAGGYVPEQMPSSYNEGQGLKGSCTDRLPSDLTEYVLVLQQQGDAWEDITGSADKLKNFKGKFYLFKKTFYKRSHWFGGFSYVDLLRPGVTEKFIDITFRQGYEKYFADKMGTEIKGVFSDETGIYAPDFQSIRWSPNLFDEFQKRWGYDLKTNLPSLIGETGNWKMVRYNYYETLLQLFTENWSQPMSEYCERHGMSWTGHYWEHEWPDPDQCPDNMAMYVWPQIPAIDMLYNDFSETRYNEFHPNHWPSAQFGNIRSVKELSSVANQMGKKRSLSETYGGAGWDFTFNDMKRLGDWEYVLGVNFMCQHLVDMSIKGARKYDYPPTYSYQEPWWDDYKYLNDYFRRLSYALSAGQQVNHVLVLEPTTTAWMYAARGKVTDRIIGIGKDFHAFVHQLETLQVEYDLGSENIIRSNGSESDGKFRVGERAYALVVIPPGCETLDGSTVSLLRSFLGNGGKVLNLGAPEYIEGQYEKSVFEELKSIPGWMNATDLDRVEVRDQLFSGEWKGIEQPDTLGKLYHQRRILADGQLFFAVNSDKYDNATGSFELQGSRVVRLDPFTGKMADYPIVSSKSGRLLLKINLYPSESLLLYVLNKPGKRIDGPGASQVFSQPPDVSGMKIKAVQKNVLAMDFCDLKLKNSVYHDLHVLDAAKRVFKAHGFEAGNPWNTMVQFRSETLKRDTFPEGTGFTAIYSFFIGENVDFSSFEAVVEGDNPAPLVEVNGEQLAPIPGRWWTDRAFLVYPAGKCLKRGMNRIEVIVNPMNVMAEIEPVYILGDFSLESAEKGWDITPPLELKAGSWKDQGRPFYAGAVDYSKDIRVSEPGMYRIRLKRWNGTVAEVMLNGRKEGIIFRPPYVLDIRDQLNTGMNTLTVRVIGSNKNLFGPFHGDLPVGLASAHQWDNITGYPPGEEYQQLDYGLMEEFEILKLLNIRQQ